MGAPTPPHGNGYYRPYKKPVSTALAVIVWFFFWPVGIFLIWKTAMSTVAKIIFTAFTALWIMFAMAVALSNPASDTSQRLQQSTQELQQSVQDLEDSLGISDDTAVQEPVPVSYTPVSIETMRSDLESNALRAQQNYLDQYVEFSGTLDTIDASGDYFTLKALSAGEWDFFETIHCTITTQEQLDIIASHNTGDTLTVQGKVTAVGEVLGFTVDVHTVG